MESRATFGLSFGKHLRTVRKEQNKSLRELALEIDSDESTLSAIENGHSVPTIYFIARICEGLNMSVSEFFKDFA